MRSALASRGTLLRFLATCLALALMIFLLSQQGWAEIAAAVTRIQLSRFLLALLLMFGSRFFVTARWHVLLRSGRVEATFPQSTRITFAGLFANNFLPSTVGGDVARMAGALQMGWDAAVSAASLVADRIVGLAGMSLALPIGLQKLFAANGAALWVAPTFAAAGGDERSWLGRMWARAAKLAQRIWKALKLWLQQPGALLAALGFTLLHMAALFLVIEALLRGMGETLPFFQIAGLWSMVYLITLVPFTINAFGLQELSIGYAFTQLGGVSAANSLALALLVRTLFMLASLPGGLFLSDLLPGMAKAQPMLKKLDG
jgi:uncharacterized membrane protein YbhN (UPF0104 family)